MELEAFIGKYWGKPGGAERAVYQMFLTEFAQMIGAPTPDIAEGGVLGDYQFEAPVKSEAVFLSKHNKRIDLYKRGCFILEAKQSQLKPGETMPPDPAPEPLEPIKDLFGNVIGHVDAKGKRPPRYDRLMAEARIQAERYSLALPGGHKPPPFLIVADIGRVFELYFDWTGDGRGYGFFPDQQNYRISLEDLRDEKMRNLLRGIWLDPASVDPRAKAAEVTRDIAQRLSRVAEQLEISERTLHPGKQDWELKDGIEDTSLFLMRVLFCMFAEDVELLPKGSFKQFLDEARTKSDLWWRSGLHELWAKMNQADALNRFWSGGDAIIRHFNGNLFKSAKVYDLPQEFKGELFVAAEKDWRSVEPAIFGTLLEQVLTTSERAKLGAHYTPRPYVQRLVNATIGDVLWAEWATVREGVMGEKSSPERGGEPQSGGGATLSPGKASTLSSNNPPLHHPEGGSPPRSGEDLGITAIRAFHAHLASLKILDPACGTGNFLYVAMELLLQLEGEAIQLAAELGETLVPAVHPNQFLGLELNPRAAVIAELVLWIGWLRHRLANHPQAIGDPVLPTLTNINGGMHTRFDAVLVRTATMEPDVANPGVPDWPEADFIVGNPPFIGGKDIRSQLGGAYVETLWRANPRVPKSADFVMQWWDHAAHILTREGSRLQRFGFVTTNSITQTFSRRVIEGYLHKKSPDESPVIASNDDLQGEGVLSLILAIPDHPWTRATKDAAAVRIAMTVAARGQAEGMVLTVTREAALDSDEPEIAVSSAIGRINADLTLGADVVSVVPLKANEGIGYRGVQLIGAGFIVSHAQAAYLGLGKREGLEAHIRPYRHGRDLLGISRDAMVIDLLGLDEKAVRQGYPEVYQHILAKVKPERDANRRLSYAKYWWLHGEPRKDMRAALAGLPRYIATVETAKHRIFQFLDASILPDNMVVAIGSDDAFHLGILSSTIHSEWTLVSGGWLGMGNDNRYSKSKVFDPFPFPDATPAQRVAIADLAEELDATRKAALAEVPGLTMTEIYNLVGALKSSPEGGGEDLENRATAARAGIIDQLHRQIDAAVAQAYGWADDMKNGTLTPSEIVSRLVALNAQRAAEEAAGHVRWLRPDYQIPRFGGAKPAMP